MSGSLRAIGLVVGTLAVTVGSATRADGAAPPRLVVWVTVDQLRGDMVSRYANPERRGGFHYLLERSVYFQNAHFRHATTFTSVGHAALFTGGHTADHGIAGNDWHDIRTGERVYCVQDDRYPLVRQPAIENGGRSPANLTASTIGDEIVWASGGRSRVFSVSGKDLGAIIPAGHLGKAFWYDQGQFVTSTYYYEAYPAWAAAWNMADPASRYHRQLWTLLDEPATYMHAEADDRPCEKGYKHLGHTFPHDLATDNVGDFVAALRYTPFLDELTLDFVRELVLREKLGQTHGMDMLAVSLSALDYIGHNWGPESLEAEDHVRRVDVMLAELFAFLAEQVGPDRLLIILASDHGMDDIPECRAPMGFDAGRHVPAEFLRELNDALKVRLRTGETLVTAFWNPSLYLDEEAVRRAGAAMADAERVLAEEVMRLPGFALALTRSDLLTGQIPRIPLAERLQRSFHPRRSGHVLVVPSPFWYLYHDPVEHAAMHGSPYSYDTYVPVFIAGPGIRPCTVSRLVGPEDIAPTVAACLGIKPPSGCIGTVLPEALP
ncbi:MAG: alkaline phosphatase family protein [Phycisphaerae bacterium]|nr:alkaline phosphatase family protein [Phycisphaerae bacterium]